MEQQRHRDQLKDFIDKGKVLQCRYDDNGADATNRDPERPVLGQAFAERSALRNRTELNGEHDRMKRCLSYLVIDSKSSNLHCERDEKDGSVQKIRGKVGIKVDLFVHDLRILDGFGPDVGKCANVHRTLSKNRQEKVEVENIGKRSLL